MAAYLSDDWLADRLRFLGAVDGDGGADDGGPVLVEQVVAKGPDGDVRWVDRYEGGRLVASGRDLDVGDGPTVGLTTQYADSVRLLSGELDANPAYMQGLIKTSGATGPLLDLLARWQGDGHRAALAELHAATTI
jgi:hypothetical protein